MRYVRSCLAGLLAPALLLADAARADTAPSAPPAAAVVAPAAVAALERMGTAQRALQQFSLSGRTSTDYVLDDGQKIALAGHVDYKVLQPNRFFVEGSSQTPHRQLYYDGSTLTIYSPRNRYYAVVDRVDRSNAQLLADSALKYAVELPLADLFLWGTDAGWAA